MANRFSTHRQIAWSTAMRDHHNYRVAPSTGLSPMFLASLERARVLDARRAAEKAAEERRGGQS